MVDIFEKGYHPIHFCTSIIVFQGMLSLIIPLKQRHANRHTLPHQTTKLKNHFIYSFSRFCFHATYLKHILFIIQCYAYITKLIFFFYQNLKQMRHIIVKCIYIYVAFSGICLTWFIAGFTMRELYHHKMINVNIKLYRYRSCTFRSRMMENWLSNLSSNASRIFYPR